MIPNFIVWYKSTESLFETYNYQTKEFKTLSSPEYSINMFEMFKGYGPSKEETVRFANDMVKWRSEIFYSNILSKPFDYFDKSFIKDTQVFH